MSKSYRAGNGKFVKRTNPVAVVQRARQRREAEKSAALAAQRDADEKARRVSARRNGYRGVATRVQLAESVRPMDIR